MADPADGGGSGERLIRLYSRHLSGILPNVRQIFRMIKATKSSSRKLPPLVLKAFVKAEELALR